MAVLAACLTKRSERSLAPCAPAETVAREVTVMQNKHAYCNCKTSVRVVVMLYNKLKLSVVLISV